MTRPYWPHSDTQACPWEATESTETPSQPHPRPSPCPGVCNRLWRGEQANPERAEPVPGQPVWCEPCTRRHVTTLATIPTLAGQLHLDAYLGTADRRQRVSGTPSRQSPSPAIDDLDEVTRWVCAWADVALELNRQQPMYEACPDLGLALAALTRLLRRTLQHPAAGYDLGREISMVAARLTERTKSGEQQTRMPKPCPRCQRRTLIRQVGAEHVSCTHCGRILGLHEYGEAT